MPAKPDVIDEDLTPWTGALASQFDIEDALLSGAFDDVRAAGGRIRHSRLDRAGLTGARLRSLSLVDVVATGCELSGADLTGARLRRGGFGGGGPAGGPPVGAGPDGARFPGRARAPAPVFPSPPRG